METGEWNVILWRLKLFSTIALNKCNSGMIHKGSLNPTSWKLNRCVVRTVCETRWKQQTAATATFQLFLTGFTDVLLTTNCSAWWKCLPPATFLSTFNSTVLVYIATWHNKNVPVEFWILALLNFNNICPTKLTAESVSNLRVPERLKWDILDVICFNIFSFSF